MTSNGVFDYFECIIASYLYQTCQEQPIFQQTKALKIYEIVLL